MKNPPASVRSPARSSAATDGCGKKLRHKRFMFVMLFFSPSSASSWPWTDLLRVQDNLERVQK